VKEKAVREHRPETPVLSLYRRKVVSVIRPLSRPFTPLREPPVPPAVPRVYASRCDRGARIPVSEAEGREYGVSWSAEGFRERARGSIL